MTSPPKQQPLWIILLLVLSSSLAVAANTEVFTSEQRNDDGIAINGYDPVAYFVANKPVKGKADLSYQWSAVTWLFANAENRQTFINDPKHYAPQYGGFCAYAASYGHFAKTDQEAWSIINEKLYLNFSLRVREIWKPRAAEFIGDADQLWPNMKQAVEE